MFGSLTLVVFIRLSVIIFRGNASRTSFDTCPPSSLNANFGLMLHVHKLVGLIINIIIIIIIIIITSLYNYFLHKTRLQFF